MTVTNGRLLVAGMSGGSGKSVVTVALTAALQAEQKQVAVFKKGPDYIDAGWLSLAAQRPCYHLDPYLMSWPQIQVAFQRLSHACDVSLIEGNRGLFDGVNPAGDSSSAALAIQLEVPVLLVLNCFKTTRTTAASVLGCLALEPRLQLAGVILNRIANPRHESVTRQAIEQYTDCPVLGVVPRQRTDFFPMRHLGVTPQAEDESRDVVVARLATLAKRYFNLAEIAGQMQGTPQAHTANAGRVARVLSAPSMPTTTKNGARQATVRIGILRDRAFQFYYEENLVALQHGGAELVMIDALTDCTLPANLDGLYIGGGFPETQVATLSANTRFCEDIRQQADNGLPIYAECGGLIYLGQALELAGHCYPLVGIFPVTFGMAEKPQAHGYSTCVVTQDNPYYPLATKIKGHEFRYSTVLAWKGQVSTLALKVERGTGFSQGCDGLVYKNVLALYTHVLAPSTPEWAPGLLNAARHYQQTHLTRLC